ncbi:hypothetical protein [Methylobacterium planeticum]|uniref:Uncharacterized protein n=1 Tax=Methylobacterium planeticum TaxID=2615211 RepID=A0A6N6MGJ5_9HYPH|nr:hypothetical protein [Methylobacterium planeticum]KAB1070031.1 hypothetical protein F6X51_23955 [Methylobacterium planeticum]
MTIHVPNPATDDEATPWTPPLLRETFAAVPWRQEPDPSEHKPLARHLGWLLDAAPVETRNPGPSLMRDIARLDSGHGLVLRGLRLANGTPVDLVALPRSVEADPACIAALQALRQRRGRAGRPLRLVRAATIERQPRLSNARRIAACAGLEPPLRETRDLVRRLKAQGGASTLRYCLGAMRGVADPVGAILSLVGAKILQIDLEHPLGPDSWLRLSPLLDPPRLRLA